MEPHHWGLGLIFVEQSTFRLTVIPIFKCKGERKIWWQLLKLTLLIAAGNALPFKIIVTAMVEWNAGRERELITKTVNREWAWGENKGMENKETESGIRRDLQFKGEENNFVLKFLYNSLALSYILCPKCRK